MSESKDFASEWQPIDTAQKKAVNVILKIPKDGYPGYRECIGHWAQDLSGEEQPPFRGWFYDTGYGFVEVTPTPTHWRPLRDEGLIEALTKIASLSQTENLLWWQIEARAALRKADVEA
jgi:hypothetical protein